MLIKYIKYLILYIKTVDTTLIRTLIKKVQEFYNLWLYKAVKNLFDNLCLIYFRKNKPVSFCTLRYINNDEAVIGLFGVSKELNGKGIGTKLINKVVSFLTAGLQKNNCCYTR